ncbi:MAG: FKBP-type peptidyl-prolyl cis-trans isomerase [Anaerolineae bacterium]
MTERLSSIQILLVLFLVVVSVCLLVTTFVTGEPLSQPEATAIQNTIEAEIARRLQATAMELTVAAGVENASLATAQARFIAQTQEALRSTDMARATSHAVATESALVEDRFMAENALRRGITTSESGLQYQVIVPGDGPAIASGDLITLTYRISTITGQKLFDLNDGRQSTITGNFTSSIEGLREGLQLMQDGATYRFWIPPDLAFGSYGSEALPPHSTLVIDVTITEHSSAPNNPEMVQNLGILPGSRVTVMEDQVRVRTNPSIDGDLVAYLPHGQAGIVLMGPVQGSGLTWWNVWFPTGAGWVAADYLAKLR